MKVDNCGFLHTLSQLAVIVYLLAKAASYYFQTKWRLKMHSDPKTKELVEFLDMLLDGVQVAVDANADGKIDVSDLPLLLKLVPSIGPAITDMDKIPSELAVLSPESAAAVVTHVMTKLAITDEKARELIDLGLKAAAANYAFVKALTKKPGA